MQETSQKGGLEQPMLPSMEAWAPIVKCAPPTVTDSAVPPGLDDFTDGEYCDETHDIAYNYVRNHYYYPFGLLKYTTGPNGEKIITRETRVIRDDRRIISWQQVPAKSGPGVMLTGDGIIVKSPPRVSECATWDLANVMRFARGESNSRPLGAILRDVHKLIKHSIWLPQPEQLYLLLFTIPVTYVQEIFAAVPYLLVTGPKGSGKSELATIINHLSANSIIVGAGSRAFAAAQLNDARGLIIFDDRETLNANDLDKSLLEMLKIGYKRATGTRGILGHNRKLNYQHVYGVKAITSISGVEEVLGTRMIHISTAVYNGSIAGSQIHHFAASEQEIAHSLRQELHAWCFSHLQEILVEYEKLPRTDRWAEIVAPLKALAAVSGDQELQSGLQTALIAQQDDKPPGSLEDLINRCMVGIVKKGYTRQIALTHLANEVNLSAARYGFQVPCEAWLSRTLRSTGWLAKEATVSRQRHRKSTLQRIWDLNLDAVKHAVDTDSQALDPLSYCRDCNSCTYAIACPNKKLFTGRTPSFGQN